jgi:hypothetical protein
MKRNQMHQQDVCVSIKKHVDANYDDQYTGVLLLEDHQIEAFNDWWKPYTEQFGIVDGLMFPEMPNGYLVNGTIFKHAGMYYRKIADRILPSNEFFEQWCWIVEHCKGKVWVTPYHLLFEDSADAVYFMMTPEIRDLKARGY